jgi:hypothetical protein
MSTLSVDTIQGQTAAANVKLPAGHTVQTVLAHHPNQSATNISSTSYVGTGLNVNITSKFANSKFLVTLTGGGWYDNANGSQAMWATFHRNIAGGSYSIVTGGDNNGYGLMRMSGDGDTWNIKPYSMSALDSPSAAAGVVLDYKVIAKINANNAAWTSSDRGMPTITVSEISV